MPAAEFASRVRHRISASRRNSLEHRLSIKEYGVADGIPVVFLHGGPGSGCRPALCRLFDLTRFRVIAPDQRGAGDSTPHGCLEDNTTQDLIADLEKIRGHLDIERWLVVGGSWGATLAIAYAEAHPEHVAGIVVRSLFLGGEGDLQRAFITLPQKIYPELHADFIACLPQAERAAPLAAYYRRILDDDSAVSLPASYAWHDYERALSQLCPDLPTLTSAPATGERPRPATPRMEAHYFSNNCFLRPGQLLDDADRLRHIPGMIVQSRYDLLCPPLSAHALSGCWPQSEISIVNAAGHSQSETGVESALVRAIEAIAQVSSSGALA